MWRTICRQANDSNASLRRYQKMKYAADNALGILKNSAGNVIVCRHVASKQQKTGAWLKFRTDAHLRRRYNPYRMMPGAAAGLQKRLPRRLLAALQ